MRLTVQRVSKASVKVDNKIVGDIGEGFLVLVGITHTDTKETVQKAAKKLCALRVFEDENEKMNLSIKDIDGELLVISQFTLYANTKNGNRPDFLESAKPEYANELYKYFIEMCKKEGIKKVDEGVFGAHMEVSLINNGPVTINYEF